ncbi:protein dehydratase [Flammeovirga sp. MY04]|uniref:MaoC/PaaZ C-terminal domain-containing protein n=1 Tax=Flammeovirga sp. MY04 TaxID=1191459 RepID=UPI00080628DF|nr:MaoC/PaaZ C-terminal domain-containing protein [Flammeovirga sp. MY04]ANQ47958.1 protein dehydratase [Flammeovirga sp. MY04]
MKKTQFVWEQRKMIGMITRIFFKTIFPFLESSNKKDIPVLEKTLKQPTDKLIEAYSLWSGTDVSKYSDSVPPHMFSQFALHLGMSLLCMVPYKISKIINQGVNLKVYGKLSRDKTLFAKTEIIGITEDNGRARVKQKLYVGHQKEETIIEVTLFSAFIIGKKKKTTTFDRTEIEMTTVGEWSVLEEAGYEFAQLTGDFNPIHWVDFIAQKTPFKKKILHGLGQLAKTFESVEKEKGPIKEIELKFIKPVVLPNNKVEVSISTNYIEKDINKLVLSDTNGKNLSVGHISFI